MLTAETRSTSSLSVSERLHSRRHPLPARLVAGKVPPPPSLPFPFHPPKRHRFAPLYYHITILLCYRAFWSPPETTAALCFSTTEPASSSSPSPASYASAIGKLVKFLLFPLFSLKIKKVFFFKE